MPQSTFIAAGTTSCCACSRLSSDCAGYLDAPSAAMAPLSPLVKSVDALPNVTIVFCSLEALKVIKVSLASTQTRKPVHPQECTPPLLFLLLASLARGHAFSTRGAGLPAQRLEQQHLFCQELLFAAGPRPRLSSTAEAQGCQGSAMWPPHSINSVPAPVQALDEAVLQKVLVLYRDVVRRVLRHTGGYEAQESEGTFMLAFPRPMKAIQFCLLVTRVHGGETVLFGGPTVLCLDWSRLSEAGTAAV